MKTAPSPAPLSNFRLVICLAGAAVSAGAARAQSLAEALDTPGVIWSARGNVSAVTGPRLTWDGVDAVRVDPDPALESGELSSVSTEIAGPSIVSFRKRSRDLDGTARFSVEANGYEDFQYGASFWRETSRLVVLEGELRISTGEQPGGNPLFLDHVVITPAATVSLNEALDAPGLVFTPLDAASLAAGIRDAELAPDGEDAVWFTGGLSLTAPAAPDGMVVSHTGGADPGRPFAQSDGENARNKKQFLADPAGETVTWRPAWNERTLDQVTLTPAVPLAEALDAPGLTFEALPQSTGPRIVAFGTADAPAGAKNGNAVATPSQYGAPGLRASGFTGPGVLRYSESPFPPYWTRRAVAIPAGVTGYTFESNPWLDDVVFEPGIPDLATLMGQPGADVTLIHPERATGMRPPPELTEETALLLEEWPGAEPSPDGLLRISCEVPSMISFTSRTDSTRLRMTADGSQDLSFAGSFSYWVDPVFALTFSEPGPHEVRVINPGLLSGLRVRPLVETPLEVALDAPGMTFTTSPDTPWRGYVTDESLGAEGGHAACGGIHSGGAGASGDPWLETTVTGPGVLWFTPARTASPGGGLHAGVRPDRDHGRPPGFPSRDV